MPVVQRLTPKFDDEYLHVKLEDDRCNAYVSICPALMPM
jgi:hypothetical protein